MKTYRTKKEQRLLSVREAAIEAVEVLKAVSVGQTETVTTEAENQQLKNENAVLKECLRPRDPETELPPDKQFVIVLERAEDPADTACYYFAHYIRSKWWCTSSGWVVYPVAWWPLPEAPKQEKGNET